MAQYARSRETLLKSREGLGDAQLNDCLPGRTWSIKDTLVHVVTNEELMTTLLRDIATGTKGQLPADFDNERFNREQVELGRSWSVAEIEQRLAESFERLKDVLASMTPEMLERRGTHPAAGDSNVKEFLLAMYAHHEVHCRDVVTQARRLRKMGAG